MNQEKYTSSTKGDFHKVLAPNEAEMKYSIYIPGEEATWMYEKYSTEADSEFQLNRHLKADIHILVDICEVLTRTFYVYLTAILKGIKI